MNNTKSDFDIEGKKKIFNTLMSLADGMACSATTFSGQGYDGFIYSRDNFMKVLEQYVLTSKLDIRP
jgi:hypothetical protein